MSAVKDHWLRHARADKYGFCIVPPIICKDGFEMSVQASKSHYCLPKAFLASGDYSKWEIGFPSRVEETLMPYCDDPENPLATVYGYVPTEIIDALIEKHNGEAKETTPHPLHPAFRRILDIE